MQAQTQTEPQTPTEPQFKGTAEISNAAVEGGRLGCVAIRTEALEFEYAYYAHDDAASLLISRRFDDYHRRMVQAYVPPDVAQHLIFAFSMYRTIDDDPTWKYLFDAADSAVINLHDVASVRIGSERGLTVTFGYQRKSDKFYIFATAEWNADKHECTAHESDLVSRDEVGLLRHYLENVLNLVRPCLP